MIEMKRFALAYNWWVKNDCPVSELRDDVPFDINIIRKEEYGQIDQTINAELMEKFGIDGSFNLLKLLNDDSTVKEQYGTLRRAELEAAADLRIILRLYDVIRPQEGSVV